VLDVETELFEKLRVGQDPGLDRRQRGLDRPRVVLTPGSIGAEVFDVEDLVGPGLRALDAQSDCLAPGSVVLIISGLSPVIDGEQNGQITFATLVQTVTTTSMSLFRNDSMLLAV